MDHTDLQLLLQDSFRDQRFDETERKELKSSLKPYGTSALQFARNEALRIFEENAGAAAAGPGLGWLKSVFAALDSEWARRAVSLAQAHLSPDEDCGREVIARLAASRRSVDVCVFTVTDDRISDALLGCHERDVRVRVISDDERARDDGSDIQRLRQAGIAVATDPSPDDHMHHKFAIFDAKILVNGSFNWTRNARAHNFENIVVTDDPRLVSRFADEFERLWAELSSRVRKLE